MTNNPPMPARATMPREPASWQSGASPPMSQVVHAPLPQSLHGSSTPAPGGLPGVIVRVGPAGGDAARTHLNAGHAPDALVEAAANSLGQAAMVGGRLDPARYAAWLQQRVQFLREIPNAAALFGSVEAAAHTIAAVMAVHAAGGGVQQVQQQPRPQPGPPSRPAVQQNALTPLARSGGRFGSPHSSLYSR